MVKRQAEIELAAGTIEYGDTGGDGPAVVLLHGVGMDGSLWRNVVAGLRSEPGGLFLAFGALRLRPLRRLPMTWGWMSKRPVPDGVMDRWFRPVQTREEIRRDLRKYAVSIPPKKVLLEWHERLRSFDRPALVVWAREDRVMPPEHGRRLAALFPRGRLVEIPDSYTLIPEDRPRELARAIRGFVRDTP